MIRTDSKQQKLDMFINFSKSQKHETKTYKDSVCLSKLHSFKFQCKILLSGFTYTNGMPKMFSCY